MIEKALSGNKQYWAWILALLALIGLGFIYYMRQWQEGLSITGLSRDVSWGLYIAQFTFLVGVAASAVMVVLPYYLHDYKAFGKITILGEFLAIAAVIMCMLFIFVDLGQPRRAFYMIIYPTPGSVMFWDMVSLNGYLVLNVVIGWITLSAERKMVAPPSWIRPLVYLSIPWAVSIHTVTAFLYSGLPGRHFWLTAILAPRFLVSAFTAGPALLILLCLLLRKISSFDVGQEPIRKLSEIVTYAALLNVFFLSLEVFTAFYSQIPDHTSHFQYLFGKFHGHTSHIVPWMWTSVLLGLVSILFLLDPNFRKNEKILALACAGLIISIWIDKGMGMMIGGFVPTTSHEVVPYIPTRPEILISVGVYAAGFLVLTVLYKIVTSVRQNSVECAH